MPTTKNQPKASTRQKRRTIRSYHFSVGDSAEGPLGLCARVFAFSKAGAAQQLRDSLGGKDKDTLSIPIRGPNGRPVEYVHVYINPAYLVTDDIDEDQEATGHESDRNAPFVRQ